MDTPRTDALRGELDPGWPLMSFEEAYDLMTDFSCALERELAAEKERGDRLEKALEDKNSIDVDPCPRGVRLSFCLTHVDEKPAGDGWTFHCAFPKSWALWFRSDSLVVPDVALGDSNG